MKEEYIDFSLNDIDLDNEGRIIVTNEKLVKLIREKPKTENFSTPGRRPESNGNCNC